MGFGMVSLLDAMFRRGFTSAGLRAGFAAVDSDTTMHFWAHRSLLPSAAAASRSTEAGTEQPPPRPVVVLIHGFGPGPTWQWAAQMAPLSRHFDLVVPTLLFFGETDTRAPPGSEASQAAAVAALLTGGHLRGLDDRPVHVVGTSYGGIVAYHLARALHNHRGGGESTAGKVVTCSSDASKGPEDDRGLAARGGVAEVTDLMVPANTKILRRLSALCVHRPAKYKPECIVRDLHRKFFADRSEEKVKLIKGMTTAGGSHLTPLHQEVLIIWGEFDRIFPVEKAHKIKEKLGEEATLEVIPNTGHLPQQEDPKLFNRILIDFLLQPAASISNGAAAAVARK